MILACGTACLSGCGGNVGIFNPAFANSLSGAYFPRTPGPGAAFVFSRVVNQTDAVIEFVVTIERDVLVLDENGNFQLDEDGNFVTRSEMETVRLTTIPFGRASELGVLFPCSDSQITRVGLGENLLPSDAAAFVGGQGVGGAPGFGIPPGNVNPLSLEAGNFRCGDTIVFRALRSSSVAGGVVLQSFLLPYDEQPSAFIGPNTFVNYEQFLETQVRESEEP